MPKVPAKQLFDIVREVVRDEVRKSLPQMVKECLTEQYIRKMVTEQSGGTRTSRSVPPPAQTSRPSLAETLMGQPEEEVQPEALEPAGDGIYQKSPLLRHPDQAPQNEVVSKLLSKENPFSSIYEGVKPLPRDGEAPAVGEVPEKVLNQLVDKDLMRRLAFGGKSQTSAHVKAEKAAEWEEQRLARLREQLDRPVNGGSSRSAQPRRMPQFASAPASENDPGFPDAPIPGAV